MFRQLAATAIVLAALPATALPPPPPADLRIEAAFGQSSIAGGNSGTLRVVVTNDGPYTAYGMDVIVGFFGAFPQPTDVCSTGRSAAECAIRQPLESGSSLTIEIPFVADASLEAFEAGVQAQVKTGSSNADPNPVNNYTSATVAVRPAQHRTDAAIRFASEEPGAVPFAPYERTVIIENKSTRRITNVTVYVTTRRRMDVRSASDAWTCTPGTSTTCTYAGTLAGGAQVALPLVIRAPHPGTFEGGITVVYAGGVESNEADNYVSFETTFGVAEDFEAVLVPILADRVSGAFGTVWSSDLAAHANTFVPILGPPCEERGFVDGYTSVLWRTEFCPFGTTTGALMYVARAQRKDITFSARLYEREQLVAQLPIVRGDDFKTQIILPDAPRPANHRYAVRVYSLAPSPRVVQLSVFGAPVGPLLPGRGPATRELIRESDETVAPGLLRHPAYAEFDHDTVVRLLASTPESVTLTVEGDGPLWAMLVVVDNATQRPVFITPQ